MRSSSSWAILGLRDTLRVERLEEGRQGEWAQVNLNEHGLYVFERSERLHYVSSLRTIHEFLTRRAFDLVEPDYEV